MGAVRNSGEEKTVEIATACSVRLLEGEGAGPVPMPPPPPPPLPLLPLQARRHRASRPKHEETNVRGVHDMVPAYYETPRHTILKTKKAGTLLTAFLQIFLESFTVAFSERNANP